MIRHAATGYQLELEHRDFSFMLDIGLGQNPSLQDLLRLNYQAFGWRESEASEIIVFGVPALSMETIVEDTRWAYTVMGFLNEEVFRMAMSAPSEEALEVILPVWNRMLESIKPLAE